jgi:iron complex outermembrane recepter protein
MKEVSMKQRSERSQDLPGRRLHIVVRAVAAAVAAAPLMLGAIDALAQSVVADDTLKEIVVSGDRLDVMQTKPVDSVFGFGKTVLETPRSLTTISNDLMTKTLITGINDLVALTPGSFTQSFFGVAGSLDIRGTPGENYFRGIKRIDNPGNYPTPLGASESIDIVRGPASPLYGPSKVGGYLNFIPKSQKADASNESEPTGDIGFTGGSWGEKKLHAGVSGPMSLFDKPLGYSLYGESENSDSYYQNTHTIQDIAQASFDLKISDTLHSEFGAMYQYYKGNQVAGWNRLTQQLIDNGTYITGQSQSTYVPVAFNPTTSLCQPTSNVASPIANQYGLITQAASNAAGLGCGFLFNPGSMTPAQIQSAITANPNLALVNPGTTHINGNSVLVAPGDVLGDNVTTVYFDLIAEFASGLKLANKSFFEYLDNINENAYGFSQYAKTWAFEDQFNASMKIPVTDWLKTNVEFGPSVRYTSFDTGDDFSGEYFDRRDITQPSGPLDARTLATRGQDFYSDHIKGHFTDVGLAFLADTTLFDKLSFLAGARGDYLDMKAHELQDSLTSPGLVASGSKGAFSFNGSLTYDLPAHIVPYVTYSKQTTVITGQGNQIDPVLLSQGNAVAGSYLKEAGIKTNQLDNHLFAAVDYFIQQRTDYNAQDTVSNNTTLAKGLEFETRYVVNPELTVTGTFTSMAVYNLSLSSNGEQFSFAGAGDLQGVNPALMYGGTVGAVFPVNTTGGTLKAGLPKTLYSINFLGSFDPWVQGLSGSVAVTHSSFAYSGFSETVKLPAYTLVNAGLRFERGKWAVNAQVQNLTDARYFRSNFPDLFGESVVLPELPRSYLLSGTFRF